MTAKPKIVVIVGPTASGKSDLAVVLARKWRGEVISADSRQVYRGMDIGTGKITKKEMWGVPHHTLDVVSPKKVYTVADYTRDATRALEDILSREKLPIVCGGTGFYVSAIVDGLLFPVVPPNTKLRKKLEKKSTTELFALLKKLDPKRAKAIDSKNPRRLVRAIEIARALGKVPALSGKALYDPLFIGIKVNRKILAKCIKQRLLSRLKNGMLSEMRTLLKSGVSGKRMEELGLEYRFCYRYLKKRLSRKELVVELTHAIVQYAKRQMTWFKKDKRIYWVDRGGKEASRLVKKFLMPS